MRFSKIKRGRIFAPYAHIFPIYAETRQNIEYADSFTFGSDMHTIRIGDRAESGQYFAPHMQACILRIMRICENLIVAIRIINVQGDTTLDYQISL